MSSLISARAETKRKPCPRQHSNASTKTKRSPDMNNKPDPVPKSNRLLGLRASDLLHGCLRTCYIFERARREHEPFASLNHNDGTPCRDELAQTQSQLDTNGSFLKTLLKWNSHPKSLEKAASNRHKTRKNATSVVLTIAAPTAAEKISFARRESWCAFWHHKDLVCGEFANSHKGNICRILHNPTKNFFVEFARIHKGITCGIFKIPTKNFFVESVETQQRISLWGISDFSKDLRL